MHRHSSFYPVLILVVGGLVFLNSLENGFTFDDRAIIVENSVIRSMDLIQIFSTSYWPENPEFGLYRPVTTLSYALNYALHELAPTGYHLTNVVLHLLNGTLLFWIAFYVFGQPFPAGVIALTFVVHPVQTEAVNGIVGRAELLVVFWVLLAWIFYIAAFLSRGSIRGLFYGGSLFATLLACFSKENGVMVIFVIALYDLYLILQSDIPNPFRLFFKRDVLRYIPYGLVIVLYLGIRHSVMGSILLPGEPKLLDNPLAYLSPVERIMTALSIVGNYAGLLIFPLSLSADYSYNQIPVTSLLDSSFWVGLMMCIGILGLIFFSGRKQIPVGLGFGLAWIVILFLPVSNLLFPIGTIMAERLLYLPSVGFCFLVGLSIRFLAERRPVKWIAPVIVLLLLSLAVRTYARNLDWKDNWTLFSSAIEVAPGSAKVHFNLGGELEDRGDLRGALESYRRALEIYPDYAEAHYNLGVIFQTEGLVNSALESYYRALKADSFHVSSLINLGVLLGKEADYESAAAAFFKALTKAPNHVEAQYNFGLENQKHGKIEAAAEAYSKVLELEPGHVDAATNLGALFRETGYLAETVAVYRRVLEIQPEAYQIAFNLGVVQERMGRPEEAIQAYRQASNSELEMGVFSLFRLGTLYETLDQDKDARDALTRFLDRWDGDAKIGVAAEKLLNNLEN